MLGVYFINCDIHKSRLKHMELMFKNNNIKAYRIPCINGRAITYEDICALRKRKMLTRHSEINKIELAISLSHYTFYKHFLSTNAEYGLIFEDDCIIYKGFNTKLHKLLASLPEFSVLFLYNGNWAKTRRNQKFIGSVDNVAVYQETRPYNAGAVSYVISRKFANLLMNNFFPIEFPIDLFIGQHVHIGKHLTLDMFLLDNCLSSELVSTPCNGEYGTGDSTQDYDLPQIAHQYDTCPLHPEVSIIIKPFVK